MKRLQASHFLIAALFATSAIAQQEAGMVKVDLATVADTLAKNIKVDVAKIPASMELPVGIAAGACGMPAAKLAPGADGGGSACKATTSSVELERLVENHLKMPKQ